jgi:serine/threonine-protein kinase
MPRMLLIPGGWFLQGARRGDADERPERDVVLDAFYIAETAVTNAVLAEFLNECGNEGECYFRESKYSPLKKSWLKRQWVVDAAFARFPANNLTHLGAEAIAQYLSQRSGLKLRLPTEAEWEGAARFGLPHEAPYPWGTDFPTPVHARFGRSFAEEKHHAMSPVDANPTGAARCGALNMAGNVWEWCADWYRRDAYIGGPAVNPTGPELGTQRVARGGCWTSNTHELRITNRRAEPPEPEAALGMGLRLAMSAPPEALHAPLSMPLGEVRLRYSLHQASRVAARDA